MNKAVIIMNGKGGVGKDYLVDILRTKYNVKLVSSVDMIKMAAKILGCDIEKKSDVDRAFLSDLKKLSSKYYDHPVKFMVKEFDNFINKEDFQILVYMIREENEILRMNHILVFDKEFKNINNILITNSNINKTYGNSSDDEVGKQDLYNLEFENIFNDSENDVLFLTKVNELIGF